MKASFPVLFFVIVAGWPLPIARSWSQAKSGSKSSQVANAEHKLEHLESNADLDHPDPTPTEFTEQEINAYFAFGNVKLPAGVQSVVFQEQPQIIVGTSRVDFDQVKAGKNSYNPLLSVFSGLHDVIVTAHAYGTRGEGMVHVDSVAVDGVEVPKFVLELFVQKYLKPRYPNIGIDSRFALPLRVDAAAVGLHKVSLSQK
jgi:hypothetical protein